MLHRAPRLGQPVARATRCSSSTTRTSSPTRVAGAGPRRRRAADQGHDQGARRHDRRQRPGRPAATRGWVPRCPSPRRRATCRSPARGRWASPTASTSATRPARRRSGSSPRPSAASATRAGALGLPVTGGNVSLYNEAPGSAIAPTPEIGIVGLLDDVATRVGPAFRADGQRGRCWSARRRRASPARSTSGSPAPRPRTARRRSTSPARRAVQAFIREAIARGLVESCQDVSGGGLAVALAEMCDLGRRRGARCGFRVGDSPAVALFGESPSRLVVEVLPRHVAGVRAARPPARPPGRGARHHRRHAAGHRARRRTGATGAAEERGSRIADALEVPRRGPAPRLGARAAAGARLGGRRSDDHVADAALPERRCVPDVRRRRGRPARARATRPRPSPRPRCSPSSTAARSRPASASPTAAS